MAAPADFLSVPVVQSSLANRPSPAQPVARPRRTGAVGRARLALSGAIAAFWGLLPHVLHHAGPLAGAALFAGVGGSLLFGVLGLLAAVPFLLRLHRRTGSWRVPGAMLALFAVMFSFSAFVLGPAITGSDESAERGNGPVPAQSPNDNHDSHHP